MKNILYMIFFLGSSLNAFAQIFTENDDTDPSYIYGFTISPNGIAANNKSSLSATNTGLGSWTLNNALTVTNNTAIGYYTLSKLKNNSPGINNGNNNTAVGTYALIGNTEGYNNSAFGNASMGMYFNVITGSMNCAFGSNVLNNITTGDNNAGFGTGALGKTTTGSGNAAFGSGSIYANLEGNNLSAFGKSTLYKHVSGNNTTVFGEEALGIDQSGIGNSVFGVNSMPFNISGSWNTTFGANTLYINSTGDSNLAFGIETLNKNNESSNLAAGAYAHRSNTTGTKNVSLGYKALWSNLLGSRNIAIGANAGYFYYGDDNLFIQSNGDLLGLKILIKGSFSANKVCIACDLTIEGDSTFNARPEAFQVYGQAFKTGGSGNWVISSDRRLKTDINSLSSSEMLQKIAQLQGVTYTLIANPQEGTQHGFIAQDLRTVFPTKVYENKAGYLSASYGAFTPIFVEALKALNERIETLEQDYTDIKNITARLDEWEKKASK